jgi:hypothetical protein
MSNKYYKNGEGEVTFPLWIYLALAGTIVISVVKAMI